MWLVHIVHSYDIMGEASVFDNKETGRAYLRWLWARYYDEASDLVEDDCYCDDEYAKLSYRNGDFTEILLLKASEPHPEFKAQIVDAAAMM